MGPIIPQIDDHRGRAISNWRPACGYWPGLIRNRVQIGTQASLSRDDLATFVCYSEVNGMFSSNCIANPQSVCKELEPVSHHVKHLMTATTDRPESQAESDAPRRNRWQQILFALLSLGLAIALGSLIGTRGLAWLMAQPGWSMSGKETAGLFMLGAAFLLVMLRAAETRGLGTILVDLRAWLATGGVEENG